MSALGLDIKSQSSRFTSGKNMLNIWTVFQLPQAYENILKHPRLTHIENE